LKNIKLKVQKAKIIQDYDIYYTYY
jgi:hypothetical protein